MSARIGLAEPEATRRVDDVIASAKQDISRARRTAVIIGFITGAAALVGAVAARIAALAGGRHRDGEQLTSSMPWMWRGWLVRPLP